jgi:hypothetical protein
LKENLIQPPTFPKFPTIEELLALEVAEKPTQKRTGFFYELLGGSPIALYDDTLKNPERYLPEERQLLEMIMHRGAQPNWGLNAEENAALDRMAFTFLTSKKTEIPVPKPAPKPVVAKKPLPELQPYWWLEE